MDEDPSSREGVLTLMRAEPGFQVLAASAEIDEVLRRVRETRPDLVLLSLPQEGDDSLTLAGALHGEVPESQVVIMGVRSSEKDVASFLRAGVSGFIMAGASFEVLLDTIHAAALGMKVLPSDLTHALFGQLQRHTVTGRPARRLEIGHLTDREREVANLIVMGLSNTDIATRLEIALHTVKSHVHKVLSKLAIDSRLEVATVLI